MLQRQQCPIRPRLRAMSRNKISAVIACLIYNCEEGGSGRQNIKKLPPPSSAVLCIANVPEKKTRYKKRSLLISCLKYFFSDSENRCFLVPWLCRKVTFQSKNPKCARNIKQKIHAEPYLELSLTSTMEIVCKNS